MEWGLAHQWNSHLGVSSLCVSILSEKYFTRSEHPTERWWNGGWLLSGIVTRCQQSVCINIKREIFYKK